MKSLVIIISNIDKAVSFEWIFNELNNQLNLTYIFLSKSYPKTAYSIKNKGGRGHYIKLRSKYDYPLVSFKLAKLLKKINPDIVHTHLRDADILGLGISKFLGIKKRITTRHFSTYNQVYHPISIKYDKIINSWATDIVAISENVKNVLLEEGVSPNKITLIHHGFDLDKFLNVDPFKISDLKEKNQTDNNYPVIGVISRYIEWKGHKYIIKAFEKLLVDYPNAKLILANANGPTKKEIQKQLKVLPEKSYLEISFEEDLFSLFQLFDIFVHAPIDPKIEAFGQIFVEALAAGIPSVFTLSGVAHEFIVDKQNAIVVDYKNASQIYKGIQLLLGNQQLRKHIIINGANSLEQFRLDLFIQKLKALYVK